MHYDPLKLGRLLAPRSIVVVGATERPASYGGQTARNLALAGFEGALLGVNPGRTEAHGIPCLPTLTEAVAQLGHPPDAVILATPAPGVPDLVDEAGRLGAGGVVVYAAGFAEAPGEEQGPALQAALIEAAARHALPVVGPNGNGVVAVHARAPMWGDAVTLRHPGGIALITQSGNVGVNALSLTTGPRFHTVVSGGNQAVLDAAALLHHLAGAQGVRVAALYLESDGDGPRLATALAQCIDHGVRVVVLKGGRTEVGRAAGAAHTAALAGDARVFAALMREAGAVLVDDLAELLGVAQALDRPKAVRRPGADKVAVTTCSGGDCAMAGDLAGILDVPLAPLVEETRTRLRAVLPSIATVGNPLDHTTLVWGDRDAVAEVVVELARDPEVGVVLALQDQPADLPDDAAAQWRDTLEGDVVGVAAAGVELVIASTLPEHRPDRAEALGGLRVGLLAARALVADVPSDGNRLRAIGEAATATASQRLGHLSEADAKTLLRQAGVPVPDLLIASDPEGAAVAFATLGGRVVVKASHRDLLHKSDIGAVIVGLSDAGAVGAAAEQVLAAAPAGSVVLVERMAEPGLEVVVAAHHDGVVPVLVVGLGGVWTDILDDVAILPLPVDAERVESALRDLRSAPVFLGGRAREPSAVAALAQLAATVGELLISQGLGLIELNPVLVGRGPDGTAVAVDAVIRR